MWNRNIEEIILIFMAPTSMLNINNVSQLSIIGLYLTEMIGLNGGISTIGALYWVG